MKPPGDLVGVVSEFPPGVQLGHYDFGCGTPFTGMNVGRNTTAVVYHAHGIVGMDNHGNLVAVSRQGLVNRVVDHLEHHVMKTAAVGGIANVHPGPFADSIQPLQDLYAAGIVVSIELLAFIL